MAEAIVSTTVEMLRDLLIEEARFLSGVRNQVQDLQAELQRMQCFLKDADKRQYEGESIRDWVRSIRDLAYKTENILETYAIKVESKRGKGIRKAFRRFACLLDEGINLHKLGLEIGNIKTGIASLATSLQTYGIKVENEGQSSTAASRNLIRQTFPHEIEEHFVGMQADVDRLVSLLTSRDEAHRIISIYGMGGSGKTTIAKQLFNHEEVQKHYEGFAWAVVSQQYNAGNLLQEILRQLDPRRSNDDIKKMEHPQLVEELRQAQRVKKCLFVLDDIWRVEDWTILSHAFPTMVAGCKMLLTTRNQQVAEIGIPHKLNLLSEEEGWDLLKRKAFASVNATDSCVQAENEKLGKEMVHKCGYLPLAISVIGGILSKKSTLDDWEMVNQDIDTYLRRGEGIQDSQQVIQILTLSYEDLPYQLKPCFLYLAYYPEDTEIETKTLYWMWIAEGMVLSKDRRRNETLEDVAKTYLLELAGRCLVQLQLDESSISDRYVSFGLHDLIRDLCLRKCEEEDFLKVMDFRGRKRSISDISPLGSKAYRLSIYKEDDEKVDEKIIQDANESTRLFSFRCDLWREEIAYGTLKDLGKLRYLRTAVFQGLEFCNKRLLHKVIKQLIHLRFLSFMCCLLEEMPSSIATLPHLQTFQFYAFSKVKIPNVFRKLKKLIHLDLVGFSFVIESKLRLNCLSELETLTSLNSCCFEVKDLQELTNLRYFHWIVRDNESLSVIMNCIEVNWRNIHEIRLQIDGDCDLISSADGSILLYKLFTCRALCNLNINVHIGELPKRESGILYSSNLLYLELSSCLIGQDPMPTLEKLPKLQQLSFWAESFVGEEMTCTSTGYPSLTFLQLHGLLNLKNWRIDEGAMPNLSYLMIWGCLKLEVVPDGMKFLKELKKLEIIAMPKEFNDRIRVVDGQEGADFHKVRHVAFISFAAEGDTSSIFDAGKLMDLLKDEAEPEDNRTDCYRCCLH